MHLIRALPGNILVVILGRGGTQKMKAWQESMLRGVTPQILSDTAEMSLLASVCSAPVTRHPPSCYQNLRRVLSLEMVGWSRAPFPENQAVM